MADSLGGKPQISSPEQRIDMCSIESEDQTRVADVSKTSIKAQEEGVDISMPETADTQDDVKCHLLEHGSNTVVNHLNRTGIKPEADDDSETIDVKRKLRARSSPMKGLVVHKSAESETVVKDDDNDKTFHFKRKKTLEDYFRESAEQPLLSTIPKSKSEDVTSLVNSETYTPIRRAAQSSKNRMKDADKVMAGELGNFEFLEPEDLPDSRKRFPPRLTKSLRKYVAEQKRHDFATVKWQSGTRLHSVKGSRASFFYIIGNEKWELSVSRWSYNDTQQVLVAEQKEIKPSRRFNKGQPAIIQICKRYNSETRQDGRYSVSYWEIWDPSVGSRTSQNGMEIVREYKKMPKKSMTKTVNDVLDRQDAADGDYLPDDVQGIRDDNEDEPSFGVGTGPHRNKRKATEHQVKKSLTNLPAQEGDLSPVLGEEKQAKHSKEGLNKAAFNENNLIILSDDEDPVKQEPGLAEDSCETSNHHGEKRSRKGSTESLDSDAIIAYGKPAVKRRSFDDVEASSRHLGTKWKRIRIVNSGCPLAKPRSDEPANPVHHMPEPSTPPRSSPMSKTFSDPATTPLKIRTLTAARVHFHGHDHNGKHISVTKDFEGCNTACKLRDRAIVAGIATEYDTIFQININDDHDPQKIYAKDEEDFRNVVVKPLEKLENSKSRELVTVHVQVLRT